MALFYLTKILKYDIVLDIFLAKEVHNMAKLNLTEFGSKKMDEVFRDTFDCFRAYHPSFGSSLDGQNENNLLEAIKSSMVYTAEALLEEDHGVESSDVDIELKTIFEILNGEKPSGVSCTKFNLKFIGILIKKLEDCGRFDFPAANIVRKNAIKYRTENKDYLKH